MVERGHAGGRKAQHEAVKSGVVKALAPQGGAVIGFVAAQAVTAIEVLQAQCIVSGFGAGRAVDGRWVGLYP